MKNVCFFGFVSLRGLYTSPRKNVKNAHTTSFTYEGKVEQREENSENTPPQAINKLNKIKIHK